MVPSNLKVLAKFGLCSNCSQKLDECLLIHDRKIFATARMLEFLFKFPAVWSKHNLRLGNKTDTGNNVSRMGKWETLRKHARAMTDSGKGFLVFLTSIETDRPEFSRM